MGSLWPIKPRIASRIDRFVSAYVKLGRFSGAVLVACGDRVLFKQGYGQASHEHGASNSVRTSFRIGSQTKAFTAIAILQLQEQGQLDIHASIDAYLPGYPRGDRITLHHLLTNTSGIPDYITADVFRSMMGVPHTPSELISTFKDLPLLFEPGTSFSYSNSGWVLLGAIVERLSGRSYGDYVQERIFAPLEMARSGLARSGQVLHDHADGYLCQDGQVVRAGYLDNANQYAAGALHSTVEDMYRWDRALYGDQLLSRASRERMFAPYIDIEMGAYGYGCATRAVFGRRCIETSGGTLGFVSITTRYVDDDVAIVLMSNFENSPFQELERGLAAIVFGQPYELPSARTFVAVNPALFDAYIGRYTSSFMGRKTTLDITREGDRLMVEAHGLQKTEMRPLSATRYFAQMKGEVELTFITDGEPAQELALNWAGHALTARRVA
jgi:CubicO group peptidase (beta-lactamase class C family)